MIFIADSGSTKTDWCLISDGKILESFQSSGINPTLQALEHITQDQLPTLKPFSHLPIKHIRFFGAGCTQVLAKTKIEKMLGSIFSTAKIEISSDLLGAAKAVFNERSGIACILGTGSNSGLYNGKEIVENIPSLGYLLGDEGGGNQIGKQLLIDYLRSDMPMHISDTLKKDIGGDRAAIYHQLYQLPFPNRFMSRMVQLISLHHADDTYFRTIVEKEFDRFFVNCINKYQTSNEVSVGFVGSLAFYFQDLLEVVASKHAIKIFGIVEKPIDALAKQCSNQFSENYI
ncbi:MAG: N-acetylglucosamine kinase [Cyclobacteriaceae bacterium]